MGQFWSLTIDDIWDDYREWRRVTPTGLVRLYFASFGIAVLVTIIVLIATSLHRLESDEYGIKYNTLTKSLSENLSEEGLHSGPPGFRFIKFKSTYSTIEIPYDMGLEEYNCVSKDGLLVKIELSFQYLPDKTKLTQIVQEYRDSERYRAAIIPAGVSAVNHGCGQFNIQSFQGERGRVSETMFQFLKQKLEGTNTTTGMHALAIDVQLKNVELPSRYENAVRAKQAAEEDIELATNQRKQLMTQAQTKLKSAEEAQKKTLDEAHNNADIAVQQALYDANTTRVYYDTESEIYKSIQEQLELSQEGFLAYLSNRALENTNDLRVSLTEPAKTSYKQELR